MRTISADYEALLAAQGGTEKRFRVQVKDSGGTFRDLTTYGGQDMTVSVSWSENHDGNGHDAKIELRRAQENHNLSPYMQGSPLNRAFAYPGTYAPLLELAREVKVEWSIAAAGSAPSWVIGFHGYIDGVNPGNDGSVSLTARGQFAQPLDVFIEKERVYAYSTDADATKGFLLWLPSETIALNDLTLPSSGRRNGHFYKATSITSGVTGTSEPTWPTGSGATVVDNGVTWTEMGATTAVTGTAVETVMQRILNDNGLSGITLNTPVSPSWAIKFYQQERTSVWAAIRALADQIGWDIRFRWNSGLSDYRLELVAVDRAKTTPDRTFGPGARRVRRLEVKLDGIRNAVRVIFLDSQDLDPQGNPRRKVVEVSDSTSIAKYGRKFMEASEGPTSNIDTSTEATTFATAMLDDLKDPVADLEVEMPFFPFVELGDLYRFSSDGIHFDANQDLAVVAYSHSLGGGEKPKATTTITCRGKPAGGYARWLMRDAGRNAEVHKLADNNNAADLAVSASDVVGGTKLTIASSAFSKHAFPRGYEFHVSDTPSFTPSASTLAKTGLDSSVVVPNLIPGKQYYTQIVPFHFNAAKIVRSYPTPEQSFVAGRASAGHIHDGMAIGDYPLNGGFETRLDAAGMPDHWSLAAGALSTDVDVMEDGNGISGGRYMRLKNTTGNIQSGIFPIINEAYESGKLGRLYRISWWRKAGASNSAGATHTTYIRMLDSTGAEVDILTGVTRAADDKKGHWVHEEAYVELRSADPSVRAIQLRIKGTAGATFQLDVDEYRVQAMGSPWYDVGDTSNFTDNYESIPGFNTGYSNYDSANHTKAQFRKDQHGHVWARGLVKHSTTTTINTVIFTLPVSYRPPKRLHFLSAANGEQAVLEVASNGDVIFTSAQNANPATYLSLDCIHFETHE